MGAADADAVVGDDLTLDDEELLLLVDEHAASEATSTRVPAVQNTPRLESIASPSYAQIASEYKEKTSTASKVWEAMGRTGMWAQRLVNPYRFETQTVVAPSAEQLAQGQVLLRITAVGICGSDLPYFRGEAFPFAVLEDGRYVNPPGAPLHEIAGEVIASEDDRFEVGSRAVGWASGFNGLAEMVVADGAGLWPYHPRWRPDQAVALQPLACVISAVDRLGDVRGARAAVIGQGPIGLLFSLLLKSAGAEHVTGIDRVDRSDVADVFGVDEMVHSTSGLWAARAQPGATPPDIVVEAVGHQVATVRDAVGMLAPEGRLYCFGVPDDPTYPFPMETFFRKNGRLFAGVTLNDRKRDALARAEQFLEAHPILSDRYVTDVFTAGEANDAFGRACRPVPGQLKVVIATG